MIKKWLLFAFVSVFGVAPSLFANGGGYSGGGVSETGSIAGFTPSGTEAVQIAEENLDITLKPNAADVEVRYLLKNTTASPATVRFGFPVEELDERDMDESGEEVEGAPKRSTRKTLDYCKDYRVKFMGKTVQASFELQPGAELSNAERRGIRGWLISEIVVPVGDAVPLKINYSADYPTDEVFVSDDARFAAKTFNYRLSTGAVWNGPIAKGTVNVRTVDLPANSVRVLAPAGRFQKVDTGWQWTFTDLEPTLEDDLRIEATPAFRSYGHRTMAGSYLGEGDVKPVEFVNRADRWSVRHSNFSKVTASSTLAPQKGNVYDAKNVADGDFETVWVEGAKNDGTGEWIEATLEVPKPVEEVTIGGGYLKEEALFEANARPKEVEIILNGEHRFKATLPDRDQAADLPVIGYDKPVQIIRLVIQSVYPGKKWQDCAITSLAVLTPLDKKPNVQPAR